MPRARSSARQIGGGGNLETEVGSATAPGQARNLSADTSKALEITFKATAPAFFGTKANGVAVEAAELKYWLYYAKVGVTSNSITASDATTAAEVITAVGSATDATDKAKGRIEAPAANLATGFTLGGLTATHTYRYTVVVIHPNGTTNSKPAPAQTSGEVRVIPSQATKTGVPTLNAPNPKTSTGFTVTWDAPDVTTAKDDDGEQLDAGDVSYVVYYTSDTEEPAGKEAVKTAGSSATKTSGNEPVGKGASKTATAFGKAFVHTVYIVLEAINTTDTSKTILSEVTKYAVTGARTPPKNLATPTVTPRKRQLTVKVEALSAGNFGTSDNGSPLDNTELHYVFYYVKKGQQFSVAGTPTNVEDATVTSEHIYTVLKDHDVRNNTADKGKVTLTLVAEDPRFFARAVASLTPGSDYYWFVRVGEKSASSTNYVSTAKTKTTTLSAAAAGTGGTEPSITKGGGAVTDIDVTFTPPSDWGTRKDGTRVDKKDVVLWLFYLKDKDGDKTVQDIIDAVGTDAVKVADKTDVTLADAGATKGVIQLHGDGPYNIDWGVTSTQYAFFVRIIHPDSTIANKAKPKANEGKQYKRDTVVIRHKTARA